MVDAATVLDSLNAAVFTVDGENRLGLLNPAAEELLNVSAVRAVRRPLDRILPGDHPIFSMIDAVRGQGGGVAEYDVAIRTPRIDVAGASVQLSPLDGPPGAVAILVLPTMPAGAVERPLATRDAARSVGGMASILAHEVRNPMAGIRGAAQLIEPNLDGPDRELARLIRDEADRVAALIDRVETLGGPGAIERRPLNIHEVLRRVRRIAEAGFADRIAFVEAYDPSLPELAGDRDRLVQLFLNLVRNAADACPEEGGEIVLRTVFRHGARLSPPGGRGRRHLPLEISVRDNGAGIPEALRDRLFDPFVSSRPGGQGLGLALARRFADDHGGAILFESGPGRTVFRVMLPLGTERVA